MYDGKRPISILAKPEGGVERSPTVAILLATYNGETYLNDQLASIMMQSYTDILLYIRDDGSTDQSMKILLEWRRRFPQHIMLIENADQRLGVIQNFHRLMQIALENGKESYFMLADQDDVWFADKVELTLQKMKETECEVGENTPVLIHTNLSVTDADLRVLDSSFWHYQHLNPALDDVRQICMQNMVTGCTVMINRSLLCKALPIPEAALMHDWWLALVAAQFGVIRFIPRATIFYRQHGKNDTGAKKYGFSHVARQGLERLRSGGGFWQLMQRNQRQAAAFLQKFDEDLPEKLKTDLECFTLVSGQVPIKDRLSIIFVKRFYRHGWIRNLGLALRLVLG